MLWVLKFCATLFHVESSKPKLNLLISFLRYSVCMDWSSLPFTTVNACKQKIHHAWYYEIKEHQMHHTDVSPFVVGDYLFVWVVGNFQFGNSSSNIQWDRHQFISNYDVRKFCLCVFPPTHSSYLQCTGQSSKEVSVECEINLCVNELLSKSYI